MKAADVMVTDVITVRPQDTVQTAAAVLLDKKSAPHQSSTTRAAS